MSFRRSAGGSRLDEVLGIGLSAHRAPATRPAVEVGDGEVAAGEVATVFNSAGNCIGHAQAVVHDAAKVYIFTAPEALRGVRVHPPLRVSAGLVSGLAGVLSDALSR